LPSRHVSARLLQWDHERPRFRRIGGRLPVVAAEVGRADCDAVADFRFEDVGAIDYVAPAPVCRGAGGWAARGWDAAPIASGTPRSVTSTRRRGRNNANNMGPSYSPQRSPLNLLNCQNLLSVQ